MSERTYIGGSEQAQRTFFQNFFNNIDAAAAPLGLLPEMVAALKAQSTAAFTSIDDVIAARLSFASTVAAKNTAVASASSFVKNEVSIIKRLPGYTEAIGESLGIIPPPSPFDPNTYQAKILSVVNSAPGGQVKIRFNKAYGNISGVNVYYKLQTQPDWTLLGLRLTTPSRIDTPLAQPNVPEVRDYRVIGVINDVEIGLPSDTVTLVVD